jgi:hypothetical protein
MLSRQSAKLLFLFILASIAQARAQYELPDEIFERTLLIRSGDEMATAFKFDQAGRIYLVTTRQIAKDLPPSNAIVQVWHGKWIDYPTALTLFPASKDVDLCILETGETISRPYKVVKSSEVLTTGQKVWYMGWVAPAPKPPTKYLPNQLRPFPEIPMVKIGTISAIEPIRPDSFEISVKGKYNLRIASGPVVYWSPVHRDFEVLGVIAANRRDAVRTSIQGSAPQEIVNTGTMKAYSIDIVVDTISAK